MNTVTTEVSEFNGQPIEPVNVSTDSDGALEPLAPIDPLGEEKFTAIPEIDDDSDVLVTKLDGSNTVIRGEEIRTDILLKKKIFTFIVVMISVETIGVMFLPYVKWITPTFTIDEWALRLLILGMLAQPYLILQIMTKYLFSDK